MSSLPESAPPPIPEKPQEVTSQPLSEEKIPSDPAVQAWSEAILVLSNSKNNWVQRMKMLVQIGDLILGVDSFAAPPFTGVPSKLCVSRHPEFACLLDKLQPVFALHLSDLRSSLVREACRLLIIIAETVFMAPSDTFPAPVMTSAVTLLLSVVPLVLRRLYASVKVISGSAQECLLSVMQQFAHVHSTAPIEPLCSACADPHAIVRHKCIESLQVVLHALPAGSSASIPNLPQLLSTVQAAMEDANEGARAAGRLLFFELDRVVGSEPLLQVLARTLSTVQNLMKQPSEKERYVQFASKQDELAQKGLEAMHATLQFLGETAKSAAQTALCSAAALQEAPASL